MEMVQQRKEGVPSSSRGLTWADLGPSSSARNQVCAACMACILYISKLLASVNVMVANQQNGQCIP